MDLKVLGTLFKEELLPVSPPSSVTRFGEIVKLFRNYFRLCYLLEKIIHCCEWPNIEQITLLTATNQFLWTILGIVVSHQRDKKGKCFAVYLPQLQCDQICLIFLHFGKILYHLLYFSGFIYYLQIFNIALAIFNCCTTLKDKYWKIIRISGHTARLLSLPTNLGI